MNYEIKKVCLEDVQDYVKVNTEAWIESYQGIVSQEFLEKIQSNLEQRIESMKKTLMNKKIVICYCTIINR